MSEMITFPETWEEFEKSYGFTDKEELYTNGSRLIPCFRVKQWLDHLETPKGEAVEVVRCKNCSKKEYCRTSNVWAFPPSDNWFCADGERKPTMTNRQYLETLSDNELARHIVYILPSIWLRYNNSELGLSSWLAEERREDERLNKQTGCD